MIVIVGGAALAVLVGFLVLGCWRSAAITGLLFPLPVLAAIAAIWVFGWTQNPMTLLGLSFAIGFLLDDAIVVQENTVRHLELGSQRRRAALLGTAEVRGALIAATLALIPVFIVLAVPGGLATRWLAPFAVTAAAAVLVSALVSLTLHRRLAAVAMALDGRRGWIGGLIDRLDGWVDRITDRYHDALAWTLDHRVVTTGIALGLLAAAVAGWARIGRTELLPVSHAYDSPGIGRKPLQLEVRGPDASTLAGVAKRIADEVRLVPGAVDVVLSTDGGSDLGGERVVTVEASVSARPLRQMIGEIDARLLAVPLPPGYRIIHRGAAADEAAVGGRLVVALGLGAVLLYLVLVRQLGSFVAPLGIVLTLPLAPLGAVLGLIVTGGSLTLPGIVGMFLVTGIAVRQATLLVTCARRRQARGVNFRVALIEAGRVRFRPILLTTVALAAGMVPLVADGGESFAAFGMATIAGVITAALTTLVVIPSCLVGASVGGGS